MTTDKAKEQFVAALKSGDEARIQAAGEAFDDAMGVPGYAVEFRRGFSKRALQERERMQAIIESPEGLRNPGLAKFLACDSDTHPVEAVRILQASEQSSKVRLA